MPITLSKPSEQPVTESGDLDAQIEALLSGKDGLTMEGEVIALFLESVEFDDILSDPDLKEFVEIHTAHGRYDEATGEFVDEAKGENPFAKKGKEKGKKKDDDEDEDEEEDDVEETIDIVIESMPGEVVAEMVDEDDLYAMFEFFCAQLPEGTVTEKAHKAAILAYLDEGIVAQLDEKSVFKKGDFRKIHKGALKTAGGKTGPELVKRMLIAMMKKEAIKRAEPGKGYKGGDYQKNPAGYGKGTASGIKKVAMYKNKSGSKLKAASRKVKGQAGAEAKLKAAAKAKGAKDKAKASLLAKKKPSKDGKKKSLVASEDPKPVDTMLSEGLALTSAIVGNIQSPRQLNG